ncbi:MAG: polysaccharide deacetylase family protein [Prevotellaceae bacterium]|jgi:hypothetical protein|nr:polysaccharide deacetylase family protein [Prevotellaceae bacterium]
MPKIVEYIINFLLFNNQHLVKEIGYTNSEKEFEKYRIIIIPSRFFDKDFYGTKNSIPVLPLQKIDGAEVLFGTPEIEQKNGRIFVKADIIAGSFFLLSRYEEWVCSDVFDVYTRFEGKKSLPFRAEFLHRPLVDEYAALLRKWLKMTGLQVNEPKYEISKIYLTHDIDIFAYNCNLRLMLSVLRQKIISFKDIIRSLSSIKKDKAYTFDWLVEQDLTVKNAEKVFFIKAVKNAKGIDYPMYNLKSRTFQNLLKFFAENSCKVGLHASCMSFNHPQLIENEQQRLSIAAAQNITLNRCHFLRILPPDMPQYYKNAGIVDDFSLSFSDIAGFRLGTCRPVQWINPKTLEIEPITLHPLLIMECTLGDKRYMNLSFDRAFDLCKNLLEQTKKHNGEAVLLFHNTAVINDYYRMLYEKIIELLKLS